MGLYNVINLKKGCPSCSKKVEWQTKILIIDSIYPVANVLKTYVLNKRMSGEVHTYCNNCGAWSEAKIKDGRIYNLKFKIEKPERLTGQKGFVPLILILAGLVISIGVASLAYVSFVSPAATTSPTSIISTPTSTPAPLPTTNLITLSTPKPAPTIPPYRDISIRGYAYEDRNDDGIYNSDDPKLPNMQFYLYDAYSKEQISTVYSDGSGYFGITLSVRSGLTIKPTSYNNFVAKSAEKTVTNSASDLVFRFRSASAVVPNQNIGIIEGNVYQDSNRNRQRETGENPVYFYKLYLKSGGSYFNTVENAQATDPGGHFKFINLPVPAAYTLELSNPTGEYDILQPTTAISLSATSFQNTNVEIPVYRY